MGGGILAWEVAARKVTMGESWASANRRRACLICGMSGAHLLLLPDGRNVRACTPCLRGDGEDWSRGTDREPMYEESEHVPEVERHDIIPAR